MPTLALDWIANLDQDGYVLDTGYDRYKGQPIRGIHHCSDWVQIILGGESVPGYLEFNDVPHSQQVKYGLYNVGGTWYFSGNSQLYSDPSAVPSDAPDFDGPTPFHDRKNFFEISVQHDKYGPVPADWCENHEDYLFLVYHPKKRSFFKLNFSDIVCALGEDLVQSGDVVNEGFSVDVQMPTVNQGLASDLNGDGEVSTADLLEFLVQFGNIGEPAPEFASMGIHREGVNIPTSQSDEPDSVSAPIGTYSSTTSFAGNLIPVDFNNSQGNGYSPMSLSPVSVFEDLFPSNDYYAYFENNVDILTSTAFNSYAQISVVNSSLEENYDIDHIKFDDPNFLLNGGLGDDQSVNDNYIVSGRFPQFSWKVDFEREYAMDTAIAVGYRVEHIKTDGTIENYYRAEKRVIPASAGLSGTIGTDNDAAYQGPWLNGVASDENRFKTTLQTQEWRVFVAVAPYGSYQAPYPHFGEDIVASHFTSLRLSGFTAAQIGKRS